MHPSKFMGRNKAPIKPAMSDAEKLEKLSALGITLGAKRDEAVSARQSSGIEDIWLAAEEAYLGIDDANRAEFSGAKWAKPTSMNGPVTTGKGGADSTRSNAFVRLTSRYVNGAAAKLAEIILPIDDKPFSFTATPVPELIKGKNNHGPMVDQAGNPVNHPAAPVALQPAAAAPAPPVPGTQLAAPGQAPAPAVAANPATPAAPTGQMTVAEWADQQSQIAADCADKAETRIYDWMVESKFQSELRKVIKDAARIGCGVLKGPFPDIKKSQSMTKAKDGLALTIKKEIVPVSRWIDAWNFFPADGCGENIHDGDGTAERDFLTRSKLKALKEDPTYLPQQIDKVLEEGPNKCDTETANPADKKNKNNFTIWYLYHTLSREELEIASGDVSLLDDIPQNKDDIHVIVTMVNDTVIRAIVNPLDSGRYPYHVMNWSRRPGCWAGVGVSEQMSTPQRITNAATRALLNNAGISSGVQIVLDREGIVPADGSYVITPNKIWYKTGESTAANISEAFACIVIPSVQQQMMAVIEYGMKLAEEATSIPLITQGQTGPTTPQTFGAAELQNNNSLTWLRAIGADFDDQITEPVVNDYYEYLLLDPKVPDDEKGDCQINAHGSTAMVERAIQEQTLQGLLAVSANPAFKVDPPKLFAEYLRSKRLDPRTIQYTQEQQDQQNAQPAQPPLPIALETLKGQNALQVVQAKSQAEMQQAQQEMQQEQQNLQAGNATPHMAAASAKIEEAKIRAASLQSVEQSRAQTELEYAQTEAQMARDNANAKMAEMQMTRELAILQYAHQQNMTLEQVKADLAKTAMVEQTKRELGAVDMQARQTENASDRIHSATQNHADRTVDLAKHASQLQQNADLAAQVQAPAPAPAPDGVE